MTPPYLIQMKEQGNYMMGFVLVTEEGRAIVIDGGREGDSENLLLTIGGRRVAAWIFTHAHDDHIGAFYKLYREGRLGKIEIDKIYHAFPTAWELNLEDPPDPDYFRRDISEMLPEFYRSESALSDKLVKVKRGDTLDIDGIKIEFLFSYRRGLNTNTVNDSSLVFKMTGPRRSVIFLGDIGPDAGEVLYREAGNKLSADAVQMAHHGHMGATFDVYRKIAPKTCLWCCPEWLYNEPEIPSYLSDTERMVRMRRQGMFGTALTKVWMDILGAKEHLVSKDGPNLLEI